MDAMIHPGLTIKPSLREQSNAYRSKWKAGKTAAQRAESVRSRTERRDMKRQIAAGSKTLKARHHPSTFDVPSVNVQRMKGLTPAAALKIARDRLRANRSTQ